MSDARDPERIERSVAHILRQRFFGLIAGHEDCNDHDTLRSDPVFKLVAGKTPDRRGLASQPTLSQSESAIDIPTLWRLHDFLIDDCLGKPPHLVVRVDKALPIQRFVVRAAHLGYYSVQ
ncbi:MAG: transposase [Phycisphaerae bacterium]|nr:transposase [Phycisphaerae bacterium]